MNQKLKFFVFITVVFAALISYLEIVKEESVQIMDYVITETGGPSSFDPLDADQTQNLPVMRMMYFTPLEINEKNELDSQILSSFKYQPDQKRIIFTLKGGLHFSDGAEINAEDIALAIARMAYMRPTFPVIKEIEGLSGWAGSPKGLRGMPSGIKVSGAEIIIQFTRPVLNPLFRFCLELFSIIPAKCIDLNTGKLLCQRPPESGLYFMQSDWDGGTKSIKFKLRNDIERGKRKVAPVIQFKYDSLERVCSQPMSANTVVASTELNLISAKCEKKFSKGQVHWMPSSRFIVLRFNPKVGMFRDMNIRKLFSEKVREYLQKKNYGLDVQRGLIPKLLPGYLPNEMFEIPTKFKSDFLRGQSLVLPSHNGSSLNPVYEAVVEVATDLGAKVSIDNEVEAPKVIENFIKGKYAVNIGSSGFWAQDPIGDVAMWFTKNLHKSMTFLWEDDDLYKIIAKLELCSEASTVKTLMEELNRMVYAKALIAPLAHVRRLFITSESVNGFVLPQAITSPAPWHFIKSSSEL